MACANLFKKTGVPQKNITMVDRKGLFTEELREIKSMEIKIMLLKLKIEL